MERLYVNRTPVDYEVIDLDNEVSKSKIIGLLVVLTVVVISMSGLLGFVAGI